jgi:hypothetical protein
MAERLPNRGESPYYDVLVPWLLVGHNADGTPRISGLSAPLGISGSGGQTVVAIGGQTNVISVAVRPTASGTTQQGAFYARIDGVAVGGTGVNRLAGIFEAATGGGLGVGTGNPVTALNATAYQQPGDTDAQVVGIELDVCSNKANIALGGSPTMAGLSIVSAGAFRAGIAMLVSGTPKFIEGIQISQSAIDTGGYAFRYRGDGANGEASIDVTSLALVRALKLNGIAGAAVAGPSLAFSSNLFRVAGGTSGIIVVSQDNGTQLGLINNAGVWAIGTPENIGTAAIGELVLGHAKAIRGSDSGGTGSLRLVEFNNGRVLLSGSGNEIQWGNAAVALGGGAAPTLGTIGGSGPATAAQNAWLKVRDASGNARFIPVWA